MLALSRQKALCRSPFKISWQEFDPKTAADEVLVRMVYCGVCGTDIHDASRGLRDWQGLGHEMVGVVEAAGAATRGFEAGVPVAVRNAAACGECPECLGGSERYCRSPRHCGDGFSTHVTASPRALMPLDGLQLREAALIEPLNVAIDLVKTARLHKGESVAIVGPGPIGILAAYLCRLWHDSPIWIIGRKTSARRLELLRPLSPRGVFDTSGFFWKSHVRSELASSKGLQFLITTAPSTITDFIEEIAPWGSSLTTIGLAGDPAKEAVTIPVRSWMFRRLGLRMSFAYPNLYFEEARDLIARKDVPAGALVTHTFPLPRLQEALKFVERRDDGLIKALVACQEEKP